MHSSWFIVRRLDLGKTTYVRSSSRRANSSISFAKDENLLLGADCSPTCAQVRNVRA